MTDTDPRLEAAQEALASVGFSPDDAWVARAVMTVYDALREFDQAPPAKTALAFLEEIAEECDPDDPEWADPAAGRRSIWEITSRAIRVLSNQPQPESEVMPHRSADGTSLHERPDNATAPVMGADPPWLDEAAAAVREKCFHVGVDESRIAARAAIAFANAQPPSTPEVHAAYQAYNSAYGCGSAGRRDHFESMRQALIAAKAQSGA